MATTRKRTTKKAGRRKKKASSSRKKSARKKSARKRGTLKVGRSANGPGAPRIEFDLENLCELARIGCTNETIAHMLGVGKATLQRRIAEQGEIPDAIAKGRASVEISLRTHQLAWALGSRPGNVTMMIWLGKQMLGQRDTKAVELTGPGGGAVEVDHRLAEVILKRLEQYKRSHSTT